MTTLKPDGRFEYDLAVAGHRRCDQHGFPASRTSSDRRDRPCAGQPGHSTPDGAHTRPSSMPAGRWSALAIPPCRPMVRRVAVPASPRRSRCPCRRGRNIIPGRTAPPFTPIFASGDTASPDLLRSAFPCGPGAWRDVGRGQAELHCRFGGIGGAFHADLQVLADTAAHDAACGCMEDCARRILLIAFPGVVMSSAFRCWPKCSARMAGMSNSSPRTIPKPALRPRAAIGSTSSAFPSLEEFGGMLLGKINPLSTGYGRIRGIGR